MVTRHRFQHLTSSMFIVLILVGLTVGVPVLTAAPPLFVATPETIWRLEDKNGDGDALDAGEKTSFLDAAGVGSAEFVNVAVSRSGFVYTIDNSGRVFRSRDLNNDGDAKDFAETIVFHDQLAAGLHLSAALSITVTQFYDVDQQKLEDVVYVVDPILQAAAKLQDKDGDGRAQGADEICLFMQSTAQKPFTAVQMTTDDTGRLLFAHPNIAAVIRAVDLNQDCNISSAPRDPSCPAAVLTSEYRIIKNQGGADPDLNRPFGIAVTSEGTMFVSDLRVIFRLQDSNSDEDAQDAGEVALVSQGSCVDGTQPFSQPGALAIDRDGVLYGAAMDLGKILRFRDVNSDGDFKDAGECTVFASDFSFLQGLAAPLPPLAPLGIKFVDGIADLGKGSDLLLPPAATETFTIEVFDQHTNAPMPNMKVVCDVIAGCLTCTPRTDRTDGDGIGDACDICPLPTVLEGTPQQATTLEVLYALRDAVLSQTPEGQRYIHLFYRHGWEVTSLMADPTLRAQTLTLLNQYVPMLQRRLAGETVVLTAADSAAMVKLVDAMVPRASLRLQSDLRNLRRALMRGSLPALLGLPVER
jgi:hypothetical protein